MLQVSEFTRPSRRRFVSGILALAALSACAEQEGTEYRSASAAPAVGDPLAKFRLQADGSQEEWARHLDLERLTDKPQILALSGGGEDGAFGAGALCGLSDAGTRPDFDVVTGVSTGALIAPMAFLGSSCDDALKHMFLDHDADDIMKFKWIAAAGSDGLYDTTPLAELIARYTPDHILDEIARKHASGGRLFVVTSNLATSDAIVWDMGAIARARHYDLFRAVLRASSALPGLFPPVKIRFQNGRETITETHLDGGVQMQVLATPPAAFDVDATGARGGSVYLLMNNTLDPAPQEIASGALGISQQAMTAMIRSSGAASVNTARLLARKNGLAFHAASVHADSGIVYDPGDRFSAEYMAAMYEHGYRRAVAGKLWDTA